MWFSTASRTALRAMVHLAEHADDGPIKAGEIALAIDSPQNYLSKIMHQLAQEGLLHSTRGRHGGFELAEASEDLTLARIVAPFAPVNKRRCLLGHKECGDDNPCPAHATWSQVASRVEQFLAETTLSDMLEHPSRNTIL